MGWDKVEKHLKKLGGKGEVDGADGIKTSCKGTTLTGAQNGKEIYQAKFTSQGNHGGFKTEITGVNPIAGLNATLDVYDNAHIGKAIIIGGSAVANDSVAYNVLQTAVNKGFTPILEKGAYESVKVYFNNSNDAEAEKVTRDYIEKIIGNTVLKDMLINDMEKNKVDTKDALGKLDDKGLIDKCCEFAAKNQNITVEPVPPSSPSPGGPASH